MAGTLSPRERFQQNLRQAPFEWWVADWMEDNNMIVLGAGSDIYKGLKPYLSSAGWELYEWSRFDALPTTKWTVALIMLGSVYPVGLWHDHPFLEWFKGIESNLLTPFRLLSEIWPNHRPNASVCFMAGSNPNKPVKGYSAYHAGKMGLLALCEQLDLETPDAKFFALAPGYVPTKIHKPTLDKGWENERLSKGGGTLIGKIYDTLNWCLAQPKEVIGGRNICVSDMDPQLDLMLETDPAMFKLRRYEGR